MMTLTRDLAWSAATDAGNRSMRAAGRTAWDENDYDVAAQEFGRLWPVDGTRVRIATALDWTKAGAYGPKGYTVRVFVNGALESVHPCKSWEVTKVRNRLNAEWSGKADVVESDAIPEIPGRREGGQA
jgi:hypothetical protein